VPFRAETLVKTENVWRAMGGLDTTGVTVNELAIDPSFWVALVSAAIIVWIAPPAYKIAVQRRPIIHSTVLVTFVISVFELFSQEYNPFLYFQF
jgi:hypothetical protein